MLARQAVLLAPSKSSGSTSLLSCQPPSLVSPLFPACSTLFQRARISMIPRALAFLCFHILAHSLALSKNSTPLFSCDSALFAQNTRCALLQRRSNLKPATGQALQPPRLLTEGLVFIKRWEPIRALSPLFRYGENSGDSTHAEPHARTSCHYQIFF